MKIGLGNLKPPVGARHKVKRVGRGPRSGHGKTAGRGHKGQKARSGAKLRRGFEGGQMPLQRRVPKRGFTNIFKLKYSIVNVDLLNRFEDGEHVTPTEMRKKRIIKGKDSPVKILGEGEIEKKLVVTAHKFSKTAEEKITRAGGKIEVL